MRHAKKREMKEEEKMSMGMSDKVSRQQRQLDYVLVIQSMVDGMGMNQRYGCGGLEVQVTLNGIRSHLFVFRTEMWISS